jgi:hypothetical protein
VGDCEEEGGRKKEEGTYYRLASARDACTLFHCLLM